MTRSQSLDSAVIGAGEGVAPIGGYRHRAHPMLVTGERAKELSGLQVPEPQRAVIGAGEGMAAVGAHRHRDHRIFMACEGAQVWPVCRSQSLSVRSSEPERAWRPSGLIATAKTMPSWPARV